MLFGTAKRLSSLSRSLEIKYNEQMLDVTTSYKYLGVSLDPSLNLTDHFNKTYKKSSGRLFLLKKLRPQLNNTSAAAIYNTMVLPVITYCSLLTLHHTRTQSNLFKSLDSRAIKLINQEPSHRINTISIESFKHLQACKFVRKCLDNTTCENFHGYFKMLSHQKTTRNNNNCIRIPAVRTEFAKKSAFFMAAKIYNELPLKIRSIGTYSSFCVSLRQHYS